MARYSGIRVDRDLDALIDRFTVDPDHLTELFMSYIVGAAEAATKAMEQRIKTARTKTGVLRKQETGGAAGRIKTGQLIGSLRAPSGMPITVTANETKAGRVVFKFGYQQPVINKRGQDYVRYQEYRSYTISGELLAQQVGFNYFVGHVFKEMAKAAKVLGDEINGKRYEARSKAAYGRGRRI